MRTIKFRGKDNLNHWRYGNLVYSDNVQPAIYFEVGKGSVKSFDWVFVDPETVGQFTGMYDREGKEIYEGDIVEDTHGDGFIDIVQWGHKDDAGFFAVNSDKLGYLLGKWSLLHCPKIVIGNIYDNPELIK